MPALKPGDGELPIQQPLLGVGQAADDHSVVQQREMEADERRLVAAVL